MTQRSDRADEDQATAGRILFLCSGNYFRSRFAEELFNHWARRLQLDWWADSRGLIRDLGGLSNAGRISPHTLEALSVRGIRPLGEQRRPRPVVAQELLAADRVIAMKEDEHRPMMAQHFPELVDRIEYWAVDDIDVAPPGQCVTQAETRLLELIKDLRGEHRSNQ